MVQAPIVLTTAKCGQKTVFVTFCREDDYVEKNDSLSLSGFGAGVGR